MDFFDTSIEIRTVGRTPGYNHEVWIKAIDETIFIKEMSDLAFERTKALAHHLFDRDGIGGSRIQSVDYKGVVGTREIPNPYSADNPYTYYVHRTEVVVRVNGTD